MPAITNEELAQRAHYERISSTYQEHYADPTSLAYRDRFFLQPMFEGVQLSGLVGLDAMCGSGYLSRFLKDRGVLMTGIDICPSKVAFYREQNPDCSGVCSSILSSGLEDSSFDIVAVVGGLHHLHPHLDAAIDEIYRLLKPGGIFCFMEPHSASLMDWLRRQWYRFDHYFESNEAAIDIPQMKALNSRRFRFEREFYFGNFGYLLVWNSMILRVPVPLKRYYAAFAMRMESVCNQLFPSWLACAVVCRWVKHD